ncbi:MAG TPA: acetyltransferase [Defluviitaleaceae bacterium]|jgi:sugar O-acyltransferase (sialic acid O-acetyltransferase NeuD family)|nr:acetyltransferase [Candidatus Epulonipiscium sp.]HPT76999.1 acetyltransferase [Defluviitaleaceae bacterium]HQD50478.1 acetyltransferase [Defluviitaleaceae bacterium]
MKKLLIIGAGGLGREVAQYVKDINQIKPSFELLGFIDSDPDKKNICFDNVPVLGDFNELKDQLNSVEPIYGFCAVAKPEIKRRLVQKMEDYKIQSVNIIHPASYVSPQVKIGKGVLISPYCTLTTNIIIGDYVHINPQSGIGHDSRIGAFSTLYWSVNISGNVTVEEGVEIGSKAFVKQGLTIEKNAVIGAGAVVVHSVKEGKIVVGVPAKEL